MTVHGALGISWFSHIDIDAVNRDLRNCLWGGSEDWAEHYLKEGKRFSEWDSEGTTSEVEGKPRGVSEARGDKKDVVNNCLLFLRDSRIFTDGKMSIHLALGMLLMTFFLTMPFSLWDLSSPSRDWTWVMAVKVLHLNHWTTSKLPFWLW